MNIEKKVPKVFISYSHDTTAHKKWVSEIASKLRMNGIEVLLDQWELSLGDDLIKFIEHSLTMADRVLMVCTELYVRKADEGKGGVGYEAMIVTGELIRDLGSSKFIPIVRQKGKVPILPKSMSTRYYVNLSEGQNFNKQFDQLLRALHQVPANLKPPLGKNPFAKKTSMTGPLIKEIHRLTTDKGAISSVAVLSDSIRAVLALSNHRLEIWNLISGKRLAYFNENVVYSGFGGDWFVNMNISMNERFVTLCRGEEECVVWDIQKGTPYQCAPHDYQIFAGTVLNDEKTLISLGDHYGKVQLYDFMKDNVLSEMEIEPGAGSILDGLVLLPDSSSFLFYSDNNSVGHFSLTEEKVLGRLVGHTGAVGCVSIDGSGRYAISGSSDETARLWDVGARRCIAKFDVHNGAVHSVDFSPHRGLAVSIDEVGQLRIWDASTSECIVEVPGMLKDVRWSRDSRHLVIADGHEIVVCYVDPRLLASRHKF